MPGFTGAHRGRGKRYDNHHIRVTAAAFAALPEWSPCRRCGKPMWKWAKEKPDRRGVVKSAIHHDHDEHGGYLGFSHSTCNRDAGAAKGGRVRAARYGPWPRTRKQTNLPTW